MSSGNRSHLTGGFQQEALYQAKRMDQLAAAQRTIQRGVEELLAEMSHLRQDIRGISSPQGAGDMSPCSPTTERRERRTKTLQSGGSARRVTSFHAAWSTAKGEEEGAGNEENFDDGLQPSADARRGSISRGLTLNEMGKMGHISALLPTGWPETIQGRSSLQGSATAAEEIELAELVRNIALSSCYSAIDNNPLVTHADTEHSEGSRRLCRCPVLMPQSRLRTVFDFCSLIVLMYELFLVPFTLSWDTQGGFVQQSTIFTATFWLLDIVLSFFTGFYQDGEVEKRLVKIAKRYLRSYFIMDVCAVSGDWLNLIMTAVGSGEQPSAVSGVLRIAKLGRFTRLLGLMRLMRFMTLVNQWMEAQMSEAWRLLARIFQMSFALLWLAHITACLWNAIGRNIAGDTGEIWVDTTLGLVGTEYYMFSELYQYFVAYHWGMAQITLGAHDVNPVNTPERLFTVTVNICGLIFGGTLVSVLSTSLIDFREIHKSKQMQMRVMRQFLQQHDVPIEVCTRVLGQVALRVTHAEVVTMAEDVDALRLLSSNLRNDLQCALFVPHLLRLPFFRTWEHMRSACLRELCMDGLHFAFLMNEDELFHTGGESEAAYYLIQGSLNYHHCVQWQSEPPTVVSKDKWLSEGTLWTQWYHVGNAQADTHCKLMAVNADAVGRAVQTNQITKLVTLEYAKYFHRCIKELGAQSLPSDLEVAHASFEESLGSMALEIQQIVSLAALDHACHLKGRKRVERLMDVDKLEVDIRAGDATVFLDQHNDVHRIVASSVLFLERVTDGLALTQLAHRCRTTDAWLPKCCLPQIHPSCGETPSEALRNLIKSKLPPLVGHLKIAQVKAETQHIPAGSGSVRTDIFETTFHVVAKEAVITRLNACRYQDDALTSAFAEIASGVKQPAETLRWAPMVTLTPLHRMRDMAVTAAVSLSPPGRSSDELDVQLGMFLQEPFVYMLPEGVFAWLPFSVMAYLNVGYGLRQLGDLVEILNTGNLKPFDGEGEDQLYC